ncbi:hypothetical protein Tco_0271700 [Tanacetum coccineum]
MPRRIFNVLAKNLKDIMMESLPKLVDEHIKKILQSQVPLHVAQGIILEREKSQAYVSKMIAEAIQQECVDLSVKSYMSDHILHVHPVKDIIPLAQEQQYQLYLTMKDDPQLQKDNISIWLALKIKFERLQGENSAKSEPGPSTLGNHEQSDDFDYWTDSYAIYDDVFPNEKASQELVDEIAQTVDEAKLHKVVDEMLRQQCTSRDEYQYHIDQMQNFLKSDIVWESRKEIIVPSYQPKPTPVVQSCQRDPKAPGLPLVNQDLLYLKKGNSGLEKIELSLHKFPAVIFPNDEIEERTSRWVRKCVKRFNPYARYGVKHWKNPHTKIFYIKNQQAPGKPKEEIYSNSKIVQIIKTY